MSEIAIVQSAPGRIPPDPKAQGMATLRRYNILDTPPEPGFDDIARLAATFCQTPIALITFVDESRQFFKAHIGTEVCEAPRQAWFCPLVIAGCTPLLIPDTYSDPVHADSPVVIGELPVRFYAGIPLVTPEGQAIGTLAVIDHVPRDLTSEQVTVLETLSRQVMVQMEMRRVQHALHQERQENARLNAAHLQRTADEQKRLHQQALAFDNLHEALIITDMDGHILDVNAAFVRLSGYSREEALGQPVSMLHRPDERATLLPEAFGNMLREGRWTGEVHYIRKDGTEGLCESSIVPVYDENGNPIAVIGANHDITEARRAEQELREREALYRTLGEAVPDFVWSCAANGRAIFVNQRWTDYTGLTIENIADIPADILHHPDDYPQLKAAWKQAAANREPYEAEFRFRRHDGVYCWFMTRVVPVKDEQGSVLQWIGTSTDIHERKLTEEAVRERSEQLTLAIQEVHHRCKNSLQGVSSLLEMQILPGSDVVPVEAIEDALGQIKTIALVYDLLARDKPISMVDVGLVLTNLVELLTPGLRSKEQPLTVQVDVEPLWIPTKAATSLALAVNECCMNAAKHYDPTDRGTHDTTDAIEVTLHRKDDGVHVVIQDAGPGFPPDFDPERDAHIGLQLVQVLVLHDLCGVVTFSNRTEATDGKTPHGARVEIIFPEHNLPD